MPKKTTLQFAFFGIGGNFIKKHIVFINFYIARRGFLWHNVSGNRMGRGELYLFSGFRSFFAPKMQKSMKNGSKII